MPTGRKGERVGPQSHLVLVWELCSGLSVRGNTGLLQRGIVGSKHGFFVQVEYGWSVSSFSRIYCPGEKVTSSQDLLTTAEQGRQEHFADLKRYA